MRHSLEIPVLTVALAAGAAAAGCCELAPTDSPSPRTSAARPAEPPRTVPGTRRAAAARSSAPAPPAPASSGNHADARDGAPLPASSRLAPDAATAPPAAAVLRRATGWRAPSESPAGRVRGAHERREPVVRGLFAAADVDYPPAQLLLRGFKRESLLELWASGAPTGPLRHVATYEICFASGDLGPKRREGDRQVPEGFYDVAAFNPASRFHLAMLVSYPNGSDRVLGDPLSLGGEIMIHGNCVSAGCLAMSDERIEELWVAATALRDRGGRVRVHLFPSKDLAGLLAGGDYPQHHAFWTNLKQGLDRFERSHCLEPVRIEPDGRYRFD